MRRKIMRATIQECEKRFQELQALISGEMLGLLGEEEASGWQLDLERMEQELQVLSWTTLNGSDVAEKQSKFRADYIDSETNISYLEFDAGYFNDEVCTEHGVTNNRECRAVIRTLEDRSDADDKAASEKAELEVFRDGYIAARAQALPGYLGGFEQHFGLSLDKIKTLRKALPPSKPLKARDFKQDMVYRLPAQGKLLDAYMRNINVSIETLKARIISAQAAVEAQAAGGGSPSAEPPGLAEKADTDTDTERLTRTVTSAAEGGAAPAAGGASPGDGLLERTATKAAGGAAAGGASPLRRPMQVEASLATHPGRGMGRGAVGIITLLSAAVGALAGGGIGILAVGSNITSLATFVSFLGGAGLPFVLVGGAIFGVVGLVAAGMKGPTRSSDAPAIEYAPLVAAPVVADSPRAQQPAARAEQRAESLSSSTQSPTPGGGRNG
jgi:hypothetical protein